MYLIILEEQEIYISYIIVQKLNLFMTNDS